MLDDGDLVDLHVESGKISGIAPHSTDAPERVADVEIDAAGGLVRPPFVEPHIHLDSTLTAGEPRRNLSGTLWEGIAVWSERKQSVTREDVIARAEQVLRWQAAQGVLSVRSHCDVTDPDLTALDALLELRERVREVLVLQIVAFPQEGIVSFPRGAELLEEAVRRGADVVGALPHFEDTREDGVRSLEIATDIAQRDDRRVDAHCDEIDDEQSRFVNLALQGRFDDYPKRRGLTRVKEMLAAGVNVAFGSDDVMDRWFPLGTGNPMLLAHTGVVAAQMTGQDEIAETLEMVSSRAARVLGLGDGYGLELGRPANLVVLPASSRIDAVRR